MMLVLHEATFTQHACLMTKIKLKLNFFLISKSRCALVVLCRAQFLSKASGWLVQEAVAPMCAAA